MRPLAVEGREPRSAIRLPRVAGPRREEESLLVPYPQARSEGIVTEELGDELVIYVEDTRTAHALCGDAAAVWRRCDGHSSAQDIARRVGSDQARVAQALDELSTAGLIEEPDGISRRALYKRAANLGAAAVSAPLIYSVAVRPASAAASSRVCGGMQGAICTAFWSNPNCTGSPSTDPCSGLAGCACQNLGACQAVGANLSFSEGTCR